MMELSGQRQCLIFFFFENYILLDLNATFVDKTGKPGLGSQAQS